MTNVNAKSISSLQKIFWILGVLGLITAVFTFVSEIFSWMYPSTSWVMPEGLSTKPEFRIFTQLKNLFSAMGLAFFLFLLSDVLGMIFHRAAVKTQQAERFLILTCIGFIGESVFGFSGRVIDLIRLFGEWDTMTSLFYSLGFISDLVGIVYAIAIYIVYRHFSQLVKFESEVV